MSETEGQTATTEAPTQSIEQIAAEFQLSQQETQAPNPDPQTAPTPAPTPTYDPVTDPEGFKAWQAHQYQQNADLQTTLNRTMSELNAEKERAVMAREEQELNALVDRFAGELDGVPKKLVKYALAARYNEDAAFKAIVDGRHKAPGALDKAVAALTPEFKSEFAIKSDPQIAADQRAMSEGIAASSTSQSDPDDKERKILDMPQQEFDQAWQRIMRG